MARSCRRDQTHMFLMFHLGRPDVLPFGDLGMNRGIATFAGTTTVGPEVHHVLWPPDRTPVWLTNAARGPSRSGTSPRSTGSAGASTRSSPVTRSAGCRSQPLDRRITYGSCRAHAVAYWAKRCRRRATTDRSGHRRCDSSWTRRFGTSAGGAGPTRHAIGKSWDVDGDNIPGRRAASLAEAIARRPSGGPRPGRLLRRQSGRVSTAWRGGEGNRRRDVRFPRISSVFLPLGAAHGSRVSRGGNTSGNGPMTSGALHSSSGRRSALS